MTADNQLKLEAMKSELNTAISDGILRLHIEALMNVVSTVRSIRNILAKKRDSTASEDGRQRASRLILDCEKADEVFLDLLLPSFIVIFRGASIFEDVRRKLCEWSYVANEIAAELADEESQEIPQVIRRIRVAVRAAITTLRQTLKADTFIEQVQGSILGKLSGFQAVSLVYSTYIISNLAEDFDDSELRDQSTYLCEDLLPMYFTFQYCFGLEMGGFDRSLDRIGELSKAAHDNRDPSLPVPETEGSGLKLDTQVIVGKVREILALQEVIDSSE